MYPLTDIQKDKLFKAMFAVAVLLAVFLGVKTINALKENAYIGKGVYASNVITVSGKGEVTAVPDTGYFSFSVVETSKTMKDAQNASAKKTNDVISAIKAMGIAEKDIKTESYSSYPKYKYTQYSCPPVMMDTIQNLPCRGGENVLIGYEVSQSISVKVRDTSKAGDVISKVGTFGVSNISSLTFVVDDMTVVQAEARQKAIEDAKAKAKILSKSLGVKLNKVVTFYEGGNGFYGGDMMYGKGVSGAMSEVSVSPELPTGESKVISNVTISYEVEQ